MSNRINALLAGVALAMALPVASMAQEVHNHHIVKGRTVIVEHPVVRHPIVPKHHVVVHHRHHTPVIIKSNNGRHLGWYKHRKHVVHHPVRGPIFTTPPHHHG